MPRNNQQTILEKIVVGFFRGVWWLVKLPFKGLRGKSKLSVAEHQYLISKRGEIESLLRSENLSELRHAVMEADKLADWILKKKNYQGATFADRLRAAERDMPKNIYNNIWQGHKVRNLVAHEDTAVSSEELRAASKKLLGGSNG